MAYIDALNQAARGNGLDALAAFPGKAQSKSVASSATYAVSAAQRLTQLRQHGGFTLAYSAAFQDNLEYFGSERGYIAYRMVGATAYALADPIAAPEDRETLIRDFIAAKSDVCFCQVSRPTAEILARAGFRVNELGTDIRIDLVGYKRRSLRRALKRILEAGYVIREATSAEVGIDEITSVSERWRQTRTYKGKEVGFVNRPIVIEDEVDVRRFFAFDRDGKLVAFSFYDPIYRNGDVTGYSTSFKRRVPEADAFICSAIFQFAMDVFRKETRNELWLGLSPLADIEDKEFRHSWLLSRNFRYAFWSPVFNRFVYPLQGHASHKREFGGVAEQTYFAFNKGFALPRMFKLLRACNMI